MIRAKEIMLLIEIADRAILADAATAKRRRAEAELRQSYKAWKIENRVDDFMPADSADLEKMRSATEEEFVLLGEAKAAEANARRRLETSVRRYRAATE